MVSSSVVGFTGFVTPFGSAPPDFAATTWIGSNQGVAMFDAWWASPGLTAPFATLTGSEILVSQATLQTSAGKVLRIGGMTVDPATLGSGLQLLPDMTAAAQSFAIVHVKSQSVDNFSTFNDFATALATDLNGSDGLVQVWAEGSYASGALTADHVIATLMN